MLSDLFDWVWLWVGVRVFVELLVYFVVVVMVGGVWCDDWGILVVYLGGFGDDGLDVWMAMYLVDYVYVVGSCVFGLVGDFDVVVDFDGWVVGYRDLWVCDVLVLFDLFWVNMYLMIWVVVELLVDCWVVD